MRGAHGHCAGAHPTNGRLECTIAATVATPQHARKQVHRAHTNTRRTRIRRKRSSITPANETRTRRTTCRFVLYDLCSSLACAAPNISLSRHRRPRAARPCAYSSQLRAAPSRRPTRMPEMHQLSARARDKRSSVMAIVSAERRRPKSLSRIRYATVWPRQAAARP